MAVFTAHCMVCDKFTTVSAPDWKTARQKLAGLTFCQAGGHILTLPHIELQIAADPSRRIDTDPLMPYTS